MADKFTFGSAGEIQEVEFALARGGWTHPLLKKATGGDFFGLVREVVEGRAEICRIERLSAEHRDLVTRPYIIDCDAKPFEPSGLTVALESDQLPNRARGQFVFDGRVGLYLSNHQRNGNYIVGTELVKELASKPVLPANVLDFYLANQSHIPENLKKDENGNTLYTFFWGTIYRDAHGDLCVRCLCFGAGGWRSFCNWLVLAWHGNHLAALPAS
jgi:hypothetical protein